MVHYHCRLSTQVASYCLLSVVCGCRGSYCSTECVEKCTKLELFCCHMCIWRAGQTVWDIMAVSAGSHVVNTILSYTVFAQIEAAPRLVATLELMLHLSGLQKLYPRCPFEQIRYCLISYCVVCLYILHWHPDTRKTIKSR